MSKKLTTDGPQTINEQQLHEQHLPAKERVHIEIRGTGVIILDPKARLRASAARMMDAHDETMRNLAK